jgi:Amyloid A4 N-terminal heparin-binding
MRYGKVNQHFNLATSTWETDPDGAAGGGESTQRGANGWADRKVQYCQRFYPNTTSVRQVNDVTIHAWKEGGNRNAHTATMPAWQCVT